MSQEHHVRIWAVLVFHSFDIKSGGKIEIVEIKSHSHRESTFVLLTLKRKYNCITEREKVQGHIQGCSDLPKR